MKILDGTFEYPQSLYKEDSDKYENSFETFTDKIDEYLIDINSFDDQGDIVYQWGIKSNNDSGYLAYDEQYYNSKEEALNVAKIVLNQIKNGETIEIPKKPKITMKNAHIYMGNSRF